jgi:amiloride-sensitive sodium channel
MTSHYVDISADDFTQIAIKPFAIKSTEDLRKYDPKVRHCYFDGEKRLTFFRFYTQSNCEYECYLHRLKAKCGCVAFYMPHKPATRICQSSGEKSCHCEFREHYGRSKDCGCLPSCTSMSYDTEITSTKREVTEAIGEHVAVYFKKNYFLRVKREESVGWAGFWSVVGGLLGLFVGASALSMVEVVYFVFVKHALDGRREEPIKP